MTYACCAKLHCHCSDAFIDAMQAWFTPYVALDISKTFFICSGYTSRPSTVLCWRKNPDIELALYLIVRVMVTVRTK